MTLAIEAQHREMEISVERRRRYMAITIDKTVAPIPDTYYTQEEALEMMFPVGSIYISTSATAPTFGGTWEEILVKQTLAQVKSGERDYFTGTNTDNIHYWKRLT